MKGSRFRIDDARRQKDSVVIDECRTWLCINTSRRDRAKMVVEHPQFKITVYGIGPALQCTLHHAVLFYYRSVNSIISKT